MGNLKWLNGFQCLDIFCIVLYCRCRCCCSFGSSMLDFELLLVLASESVCVSLLIKLHKWADLCHYYYFISYMRLISPEIDWNWSFQKSFFSQLFFSSMVIGTNNKLWPTLFVCQGLENFNLSALTEPTTITTTAANNTWTKLFMAVICQGERKRSEEGTKKMYITIRHFQV